MNVAMLAVMVVFGLAAAVGVGRFAAAFPGRLRDLVLLTSVAAAVIAGRTVYLDVVERINNPQPDTAIAPASQKPKTLANPA